MNVLFERHYQTYMTNRKIIYRERQGAETSSYVCESVLPFKTRDFRFLNKLRLFATTGAKWSKT